MPDAQEPFIRPDVQAFLTYINALPGPKTHEMTPDEARAGMRASGTLADAPIGEIAVDRTLACPAPWHEIPLRLFDARATRGPGPVVVFFHGGGWVLGDLDTHASLCAEIARQLDLPVVAVDYRLAPEHRWPAAPNDCERAARWVAGSPGALGRTVTGLVLAGDSAGGALGRTVTGLVLAGDSAGGTLTITTALALRDEPAVEPVLAQWPIYPVVDYAPDYPSLTRFSTGYFLSKESMVWFNEAYQADPDHWRAAPVRADQTGLPPTLVVTASLDPLRDHGRAYAATCVRAGVPTVYREADGTIHGFLNMRKALPSAEGDLLGCTAALRAMIAEAEGTLLTRKAAE